MYTCSFIISGLILPFVNVVSFYIHKAFEGFYHVSVIWLIAFYLINWICPNEIKIKNLIFDLKFKKKTIYQLFLNNFIIQDVKPYNL